MSETRPGQVMVGKAIFSLLVLGCFLGILISLIGSFVGECKTGTADPRRLSHSEVELTNLWNRSVNIFGISDTNAYINAAEGTLFVSDSGCDSMRALDIMTGEQLWETSFRSHAIILDTEQPELAYTEVFDRSGRQVRAIDLLNGDVTWTYHWPTRDRVSLETQIEPDNQLLLYASVGNRDEDPQLLDAETGEPIRAVYAPYSVAFYHQGVTLTYFGKTLRASTESGHDAIWRWEAPITLIDRGYRPFVINDYLFVRQDRFEYPLFVLDWQSGELLWALENIAIVSNISVFEDKLYFLDHTNQLRVYELSTGNLLGFVQFKPPLERGRELGSAVTVFEDIIAVYFPDSQSLSAYRMGELDAGQ